MTQHERSKRRALIVRRAAKMRNRRAVSEAQRERWRRYREACGYEEPMVESDGQPDQDLADLPDTL